MYSRKIILSIFLTSVVQSAATAAPICSDLFDGSSQPSIVTEFRASIGSSNFNQTRTINEVYNGFPHLQKMLSSLPAGAVVVDLGAGFGTTIGSVFYGADIVPDGARMSSSAVSPD